LEILFQRSGILTEKQTTLVPALSHMENQVQFIEKKEWVNQIECREFACL